MYQSQKTAFMQPINTTTFENGLQLHTVIIKNERKKKDQQMKDSVKHRKTD